ncbi:MAG: sigma-70 family RNA polymerase sigma factor [Verrucomicrobia bacterium]|nr:sigma-70 family RNA polymerase sigma factor [Verrucomicrobiota bacterium]
MDEDIRHRLEGRRYAEAFELVLDRYEDKIFRLAFSMMRNEAQARDATQDVFVRIWKGLPGYHAGAALSTWIYTITRNTCFTELKKRSTRRTVSLQEPNMEAVANCIPALQSADPEPGREMDVAAMLSELPENYRRVITLFYLEQKSYADVAAMLGLPLGTVKTLLFRAKRELVRVATRRVHTMAEERHVSENSSRRNTAGPASEGFIGLRALPKVILL